MTGERRLPPDDQQREPDAVEQRQDQDGRQRRPQGERDVLQRPRQRPQQSRQQRVPRAPAQTQGRTYDSAGADDRLHDAEHAGPTVERARHAGSERGPLRVRSEDRPGEAIVTQTHGRVRTSRQPVRISTSSDSRIARSPRGRGRTGTSRAALTTNVTASSANAVPAPAVRTSTVPTAGPTRTARLSEVVVSARASWRRSSRIVWGRSPE